MSVRSSSFETSGVGVISRIWDSSVLNKCRRFLRYPPARAVSTFFCYFQHGEKREKSVAGHESDKLIESYSAQPTTEQQFESYLITRRFKSLTQVNSVQYKWALLFLLPSLLWLLQLLPSTASNPTNPGFCQLLQIFQFLYFIVVISFSCSGS